MLPSNSIAAAACLLVRRGVDGIITRYNLKKAPKYPSSCVALTSRPYGSFEQLDYIANVLCYIVYYLLAYNEYPTSKINSLCIFIPNMSFFN